ncbi:MAG: Lrp/AsnC family transcriptional regulator [Candidatus Methanomethylicota archaeon]|uniref:Lrp/AsnC family transcriptional regulator n=1 Tax=Thermoproteota archaeon TaxID=2056631 RepID=A0A497ET30_9CREN|nr:MAG: Lrp/AsnC family transcriptional regulator [Candidatus Verstraetearchaeota archaeon]
MTLAFVLINVEVGTEKEVLEKIKQIEEVKEAYMVYGTYDIIARLEAENLDKLREVVTKKIRQLDKVNSTMTMIVMEG